MNQLVSRVLVALSLIASCAIGPAGAAEATTGTLVGTVTTNGAPVANASATLTSPSGIYNARSDARGRFSVLGIAPDVYSVSVEASGYQLVKQNGVVVLPGQTQYIAFHLVLALQTIANLRSTSRAFNTGSVSDSFTVSGAQATALSPPVSSSGLATYIGGTVQGAIASVPGVVLDQFANAILRGGKDLGCDLRLRLGADSARLGRRAGRQHRRRAASDDRHRIDDGDAGRLTNSG